MQEKSRYRIVSCLCYTTMLQLIAQLSLCSVTPSVLTLTTNPSGMLWPKWERYGFLRCRQWNNEACHLKLNNEVASWVNVILATEISSVSRNLFIGPS